MVATTHSSFQPIHRPTGSALSATVVTIATTSSAAPTTSTALAPRSRDPCPRAPFVRIIPKG